MRLLRRPKRLVTKLLLYTLVPVFLGLSAILAAVSFFYSDFSLSSSVEEAEGETREVAAYVERTYFYLLRRFVSASVSEETKETVELVLDGRLTYSECNNELQDAFTRYVQIHELVSCALITRETGSGSVWLYYPYSFRLGSGVSAYNWKGDLRGISGVTFLPSKNAPHPFGNADAAVPIAFPLCYQRDTKLLLLSESPERTELLLYVFLDREALQSYLSVYCGDSSEGLLYLTDGEGRILSLDPLSEEYALASGGEICEAAARIRGGEIAYAQLGEHYVFCAEAAQDSLYVVNVVPRSLFLQQYNDILFFLLTIALTTSLVVATLSILASLFVTRPLKLLMSSLRSIETNTYAGKAAVTSHDELEQLNDSIDSMYGTIHRQMEQIRQEETEKYETQLQLLSEQMNPHFVYNALEFINMEIVSGHSVNASKMVSSLGNYLRVGLAYGENLVTLGQEAEHAAAYVRIMNYRFSQQVQLSVEIPDELLGLRIVKCVVQPLVENSLKHGFRVGTLQSFPFAPMVTIAAVLGEECLELSVTDNGAGIDVEKARAAVRREGGEERGHVGLNNIYRRLCACYGEAEIDFSSVPFFENRVTIRVPARFFNGSEAQTP